MKRLVAVALILIASSCGRTDGPQLESHDTGIIGGSAVSSADPVAASTALVLLYNLHTKTSSTCSAVLIANDLLLTAAHCFVPKDGIRRDFGFSKFVFFGTRVDINSADQIKSAITFTDAQVVVHPSYLTTRDDFDVAVIKLGKPVPPGVKPVALATAITNPVTLAGFGLTTSQDLIPTVMTLNKMSTTLSKVKDPRALSCVGVVVNKKFRPNHGDSGGPAFSGGAVWGLDSHIAKDLKTEFYTPIATYLPWIAQTAKQLGSSFVSPPGKSLSK